MTTGRPPLLATCLEESSTDTDLHNEVDGVDVRVCVAASTDERRAEAAEPVDGPR